MIDVIRNSYARVYYMLIGISSGISSQCVKLIVYRKNDTLSHTTMRDWCYTYLIRTCLLYVNKNFGSKDLKFRYTYLRDISTGLYCLLCVKFIVYRKNELFFHTTMRDCFYMYLIRTCIIHVIWNFGSKDLNFAVYISKRYKHRFALFTVC